MSAPAPGTLVLFVGGDPSLAGELRRFPKPLPLMAAFIVPASLLVGPPPSQQRGPEEEVWLIPSDQQMCVERVAQALRRSALKVRLVDVNHPSLEDRPLVERYVGPEDVLPILVRWDGARLEGAEAFTPSAVRGLVGSR